MDANLRSAPGTNESRTRLRHRLPHGTFLDESRLRLSEEMQTGVGTGGRNIGNKHAENSHQDRDRPTSPAFLRLLSQRSVRSPSPSSRSPSVISQISSRRRMASPTIAARAWLRPAEDSSLPTSPVSWDVSPREGIRGDGFGIHMPQQYSVLRYSRDRSRQTTNREDCKGTRGRVSSRGSCRSPKKRESCRNPRERNGARLYPKDDRTERHSRSPPRTAPRLVMSPRCFPPPTFEKILLGLTDADFTLGKEDVDVFSKESAKPKSAPVMKEEVEPEADDSIRGIQIQCNKTIC